MTFSAEDSSDSTTGSIWFSDTSDSCCFSCFESTVTGLSAASGGTTIESSLIASMGLVSALTTVSALERSRFSKVSEASWVLSTIDFVTSSCSLESGLASPVGSGSDTTVKLFDKFAARISSTDSSEFKLISEICFSSCSKLFSWSLETISTSIGSSSSGDSVFVEVVDMFTIDSFRVRLEEFRDSESSTWIDVSRSCSLPSTSAVLLTDSTTLISSMN
uniref:Uncharacterized protein n=1 Tax=Cacopsylla melanoneura TaxID=428564 RepID=A0A8D9EH93_9HEMI